MAKETAQKQHSGEIPKNPIGFLWFVSKPYKWWVFLTLGIVVVAETLEHVSYVLFQKMVESAEAGLAAWVVIFAVMYPVAGYLVQLLFRLSSVTAMRWSPESEKYAEEKLVEHLLGQSHSFFSNRFAGSLLSNVRNVSGGVNGLIDDITWQYLSIASSFVITAILLASVDVRISLTFVLLTCSLITLNMFFVPKKRRLSEETAAATTKLTGYTVDIFSNIIAVRQFVRKDREFGIFKEHLEERKDRYLRSWRYTVFIVFVNATILFVFALGMLYFLVEGWQRGATTTGELVLVLSLLGSISGTLIYVAHTLNRAAQAFGEMKEGLDAILVPHEIIDAEGAQTLISTGGAVAWNDVTFKYGDQVVFDGFSLSIPEGQRVGLVGHSGAGKSTFVSLLLRQHELDGGVIEIDGQDISHVTQDSLRAAIAIVPQEPLLFHRSIRENIAYGKADATDEEVERVAKLAQAHDFIVSLPEGYQTLVGERGVKLSGGQRQRIAIARAMLKDAPILVLDEATSALDSESEVAIQSALGVLMKGKTVVAIAHRLSTLREMDRIIVLEKGKIIEDGSHEELLEKKGLYASLWQHQAGGFLQEE